MSKKGKPPVQNEPVGNAGKGGVNNHLNIGSLHYHPNELSELRKIAEINPRLAEKLIDQKDRSEAREEASFRLGLGFTLALLVVLILGTVYVIVNAGILALLFLFAIILAAALLIRVVITGEWSETNWVGQIIKGLISITGGRVTNDEPDDDKKESE